MCGIFGYIGNREATPLILKGLQRLEYRGYDSAGLAILNGAGEITVRKKKGKVRDLAEFVSRDNLSGSVGLGHTRWATHGAPNDTNAHPHLDPTGDIAIVHNGIIENFSVLRRELEKSGAHFQSETDSEILAHLVAHYYVRTKDLVEAVRLAVKRVKGSYALCVIHRKENSRIVVARKESPLVVGLGKKENFVASDYSALLDHTDQAIVLKDGELASIEAASVGIWDAKGKKVRRRPDRIQWSLSEAEKGGYSHFMLKEIFEQPEVLSRMIQQRMRGGGIHFDELKISKKTLQKVRRIVIVACGTSYHAGLVGKCIFESLTPIPVAVDMSSEFRYRDPKLDGGTLVIVISQSGETADTLAALREAKRKGAVTLGIVNVLGSSIERESHGVIYTYAGPEIAVASTKAYTAQLGILYLLVFYLAAEVGSRTEGGSSALMREFRKIPAAMQEVLDDFVKDQARWETDVHQFNVRYHEQLEAYFRTDPDKRKRSPNGFFLYLGRNINYPSALEGALKLKEIAYISAEGYAAGEMKHGPIALIDENPWVICIAIQSKTYEKIISNIQEIKARGGIVTAIITKGDTEIKNLNLFRYIELPRVCEELSPLVVALPLQLIAFCVAKEFGEEIDQPRNLAKSVTVE